MNDIMQIEKVARFVEILENHGIHCDVDEILEILKSVYNTIELIKNVHDFTFDIYTDEFSKDCFEVYIEDEFGEDYNELVQLAKTLHIKLPTYVWYE